MRAAFSVILALATGGCDVVFGLAEPSGDARDASGDDAADGGCTLGPWGPSLEHAELGSGFDPQLRGDLREIYFTSSNDLYAASRGTVGEGFSSPAPITVANSPDNEELDPSVTADGLLLMFVRRPGARAWQITRPDLASEWSAPTQVSGLEAIGVTGLDLSPDGLTLYYESGSEIFQTKRMSRDTAFGPRVSVYQGGLFPSISGDELELYVIENSAGSAQLRATRETTEAAFQGAATFDTAYYDADISPDGTALALVRMAGARFHLRYRACM